MDLEEISQLGVGIAALLLLYYVTKQGYEERKENNKTLNSAFDATTKAIASNKNKDKALTDLVKKVQEMGHELNDLTQLVKECAREVKPKNKPSDD